LQRHNAHVNVGGLIVNLRVEDLFGLWVDSLKLLVQFSHRSSWTPFSKNNLGVSTVLIAPQTVHCNKIDSTYSARPHQIDLRMLVCYGTAQYDGVLCLLASSTGASQHQDHGLSRVQPTAT
jgi:hypothetical protein